MALNERLQSGDVAALESVVSLPSSLLNGNIFGAGGNMLGHIKKFVGDNAGRVIRHPTNNNFYKITGKHDGSGFEVVDMRNNKKVMWRDGNNIWSEGFI